MSFLGMQPRRSTRYTWQRKQGCLAALPLDWWGCASSTPAHVACELKSLPCGCTGVHPASNRAWRIQAWYGTSRFSLTDVPAAAPLHDRKPPIGTSSHHNHLHAPHRWSGAFFHSFRGCFVRWDGNPLRFRFHRRVVSRTARGFSLSTSCCTANELHYIPLLPQTTRDKEKVNMTMRPAHPTCWTAGVPMSSAACALWTAVRVAKEATPPSTAGLALTCCSSHVGWHVSTPPFPSASIVSFFYLRPPSSSPSHAFSHAPASPCAWAAHVACWWPAPASGTSHGRFGGTPWRKTSCFVDVEQLRRNGRARARHAHPIVSNPAPSPLPNRGRRRDSRRRSSGHRLSD